MATTDLLDEMTRIADELRSDPRHIERDDEIAFRQLQRFRRPDLGEQQFRDLFAVWHDAYHARQEAATAATRARFAELSTEREALFTARTSSASPQQQIVMTDRIAAIGCELAAIMTLPPPAVVGSWGG